MSVLVNLNLLKRADKISGTPRKKIGAKGGRRSFSLDKRRSKKPRIPKAAAKLSRAIEVGIEIEKRKKKE